MLAVATPQANVTAKLIRLAKPLKNNGPNCVRARTPHRHARQNTVPSTTVITRAITGPTMATIAIGP